MIGFAMRMACRDPLPISTAGSSAFGSGRHFALAGLLVWALRGYATSDELQAWLERVAFQ
jgi:hypothetical protein